jgi:hypothetical protein
LIALGLPVRSAIAEPASDAKQKAELKKQADQLKKQAEVLADQADRSRSRPSA